MTGHETARCPNDDGDLRQVIAHNRQSAPIMLDQCDGGGGLWFDKFELFQIDEKDAARLAQIDEQALRRPRGNGIRTPLPPVWRLRGVLAQSRGSGKLLGIQAGTASPG